MDSREGFCFFDPTAVDTFLLPQRRLGSVPSTLLHDLDTVEKLKEEQRKGSERVVKFKRTKLIGSRAVFAERKVVMCMYKFLPYEYALRHRSVCRMFNSVLRGIPMAFKAHGDRSLRLTTHLGSFSSPDEFIKELSLGVPGDLVREKEVEGLCAAFENGVLPGLSRFHVELHSESGEVGVFRLLAALALSPLENLVELDISGSYIGQASARKLSEVLCAEEWGGVTKLRIARNGTGEYGTRFMIKGLVSQGGCGRCLEVMDFARNDMGKGFKTLPKALGSAFTKLHTLDISNNAINADAVSSASTDCMVPLSGHSLTWLDASFNIMGGLGAKEFVKLMFSFQTNIRYLDLAGLDGGVEFVISISDVMRKGGFAVLEDLNISGNSIARQGCEVLMKNVGLCPNLVKLNIRNCMLGDNGVNELVGGMREGRMETLKVLDISANNVLRSLVNVAECLKQGWCKSLRVLDVSKNTPPGEKGGLLWVWKDKFFTEGKLKIVGDEKVKGGWRD